MACRQLSLEGKFAVTVVVFNIILLILMAGLAVLKLLPNDGKENLNVDKLATGVTKEMKTMDTFKDCEADTQRVQEDISLIYQREGNLNKPAAHLVVAGSINKKDNVPLVSWKHLSNVTYQERSIEFHDGAFTVTQEGYFYIYSSIRYTGIGTAELSYGRILHHILMKKESETEERPTVLMTNLQTTQTIRRGREAVTTSSLGGIFFVPKNSQIMVTSSVPENIDTSSPGSNFGMFLV